MSAIRSCVVSCGPSLVHRTHPWRLPIVAARNPRTAVHQPRHEPGKAAARAITGRLVHYRFTIGKGVAPTTHRIGWVLKSGWTWGAKMLRQFGEEIWTADGPTVSVAGFAYPTRMIVIRLSDGALFVWSPTSLSGELQSAVDSLGPVRHIVAPNTLHHMFVGEWQTAYPAAKSYAVPALRAKRPDLKWDCDLEDVPAPEWSNAIDQVVVGGNRITTEVVFFHRRSRTAILADLIQHFEPGWFSGWRAIVAGLDFLTGIRPTVPRKFRMTFRDRDDARTAMRRMMVWPTVSVLTAHGAPIRHDGREAIAHAFEWLLRK